MCIGILSLGYSVFTHTQVILWLPVLLTPVILEKKNKFKVLKKVILSLFLGCTLGVIFLVILLMLVGNTPFESMRLLFMHGADIYGTGNLLYDLGRFIRNFGIIVLRNNSTLVVLSAVIGSILLFKKDKTKLLILILWFLPTVFVTQYWHIGLFGRVALIASFPLALLVSVVPRIFYILIVLQLIIMFIPLALTNRSAPVQQELVKIYSTIPQNSVLISSNLIRPQVVFSGEKYFINEPGQSLEFIEYKIDLALSQGRNVYIDSQALFNPYYSYDGNHLHVLSLGKIGNSKVKPLFEKYSSSVIRSSKNPRIFLYKINPVSKLNFDRDYTYKHLNGFENTVHKERIDYLDIGTWGWKIINKKNEPFFWKL